MLFPPKRSASSPVQMPKFQNEPLPYSKVTSDFLKLSMGKLGLISVVCAIQPRAFVDFVGHHFTV